MLYSGVSFSKESQSIEDFNILASNAKSWLKLNAGGSSEILSSSRYLADQLSK